MNTLLIFQKRLGRLEDHLRGQIHGDSTRQLIVDGRMVAGAEEQDRLYQKQCSDHDRPEQSQPTEHDHNDHVHGDHGTDGEFSQHGSGEEQNGGQTNAVDPHDTDTEELFAKGLAVLQKQGNQEQIS